jgi:hypothetical protein
VAIAMLVLAGCEPLSAAELRREVDSVHSFAAEAAVLADQIQQQRTKRTFARVQARELSDAAEHSAERLTDAHPADGLEQQTTDAIDLASEVSTAIGELETAPDDADAAGTTATRLRQLAAKAQQLSDSL